MRELCGGEVALPSEGGVQDCSRCCAVVVQCRQALALKCEVRARPLAEFEEVPLERIKWAIQAARAVPMAQVGGAGTKSSTVVITLRISGPELIDLPLSRGNGESLETIPVTLPQLSSHLILSCLGPQLDRREYSFPFR